MSDAIDLSEAIDRVRQEGSSVSTPKIDPNQRDPREVAPTDTYRPADRVWVYRGGDWRAGVVESASERAVTVTYRPGNAAATGVDTLTAPFLLPRAESDPVLDEGGRPQRRRG